MLANICPRIKPHQIAPTSLEGIEASLGEDPPAHYAARLKALLRPERISAQHAVNGCHQNDITLLMPWANKNAPFS